DHGARWSRQGARQARLRQIAPCTKPARHADRVTGSRRGAVIHRADTDESPTTRPAAEPSSCLARVDMLDSDRPHLRARLIMPKYPSLPNPDGWFAVCFSHELPPSRVESRKLFDR